MTPTATLVERVRAALPGISTNEDVRKRRDKANAALTELAERLKNAEFALDGSHARGYRDGVREEQARMAERLEAAERLATENGRLAQTHWDRAEAAERERQWLLDREKHHESAAEARVAELEEALRAAQALQPNRVQWFRDNGIVFNRVPLREPPEEDGERWEQIAFSIYTDLCEVESIARAALAKGEGP